MVQTAMATKTEKRKDSNTSLNIVVPIELKNRLIEEAERDTRTMRAQIIHILKKHFRMNDERGKAS